MVSPIESTLHIRLFVPHATQLHSIKSNRNSIGSGRSRVIETPNIFHHPTFCPHILFLDFEEKNEHKQIIKQRVNDNMTKRLNIVS